MLSLKQHCQNMNIKDYDVYMEARPKARAILADLKGGEYSLSEFDDSPEEQAIKAWLFEFIPAIGGRCFQEVDNGRLIPVYCFVV